MSINDEIQQRIAETFRNGREAMNMSQTQVAAALRDMGLRVHQSSYAKMEIGERQIPMAVAMGLCQVLGVDWNQLYQKQVSPEDEVTTLQHRSVIFSEGAINLLDHAYKEGESATLFVWELLAKGGHQPQDDNYTPKTPIVQAFQLKPSAAKEYQRAYELLIAAIAELKLVQARFWTIQAILKDASDKSPLTRKTEVTSGEG
ncbi:MAG: helix-turn-helix transcriptional regulator [Corynebacterium glutamicum]|nr:helix-turn-helix transcriptional regulator [Corynebacterium glutamicum]